MKKHGVYVLTKAKLDKLQPCEIGLAAALPFLPAKLSTDPLDNLALADRWLSANDLHQIKWLLLQVTQNALSWYPNPSDDPWYLNDDPYVCAQLLAMIADFALTKEGK